MEENENRGFTLNSGNLEDILLSRDADKPVIVISVTGQANSGKSFILDFMLRYLRSSDWLGDKAPSFSYDDDGDDDDWPDERKTRGIMMWNQLLPVTLPTGEEAVVVLMDTLGYEGDSFDGNSSDSDSSDDDSSNTHWSQAVVTLASLFSSLQIFNAMDSPGDKALEQLQQSSKLGQFLTLTTNAKAFQTLMFLVRDWEATDKFPVGTEGGNKLVNIWLEKERDNAELKAVSDGIRESFSDINGFLLPHPGLDALSQSRISAMNSGNMDPTFVVALQELIRKALAPENLAGKVLAGNRITARHLCALFTKCAPLFLDDSPPKPQHMLSAISQAHVVATSQSVKSQYMEEMTRLLRQDQPALQQEELIASHKEALARAEERFSAQMKTEDEKLVSQEQLQAMRKEIDSWFTSAKQEHGDNDKDEKMAEKRRAQVRQDLVNVVHMCVGIYTSNLLDGTNGLRSAIEENGFASEAELQRAHCDSKEKAMDSFDVKSKKLSDNADSARLQLQSIIGARYRLMKSHNGFLMNAEERPAARTNMKAVNLAVRSFRTGSGPQQISSSGKAPTEPPKGSVLKLASMFGGVELKAPGATTSESPRAETVHGRLADSLIGSFSMAGNSDMRKTYRERLQDLIEEERKLVECPGE